jgi:SWI/SNF-related matrix-associated actin-dependent regulator of chromatin subfamily A-like protein 1
MKTLLPHQIEDAQFLAARHFAGNFSGMGSGKTLSALEAFRLVRELVTDQVIIVGPPISLRMWQAEFEEFFPGDTAQLVKTGKTKIDGAATALIMSYEIATKRAIELSALGARALIMDEAHACKSVKAKRTKAILGSGGLAGSVDHTWFLTGTPVTRWNDDLYPFLCRADLTGMKARCGGDSTDRFNLRYTVVQSRQFPGARYPTKMTVGSRNTDELHRWLFGDNLAVRRELADVWAAMPPLTTTRLQIGLDMDDELRDILAGFKTVKQIEQAVASNDEHIATARRKIGEGKVLSAAAEIRDRIDIGQGPILVGAWHRSVIDALAGELSDLRVGVLDGRTSANEKGRLQDAFNNKDLDVLIGQIAAMGVSLNLQHGGNRIIVVEEDWSPAVMDQFYARLHRIGQTEHVHVDILESDDKLSQAVRRISNTKRGAHAAAMGDKR